MVLMGMGIRFVYRTSFLTAVVTAVGELHAYLRSPDLASGHDRRAGLSVSAAYSLRSRFTRRRTASDMGSVSLPGFRP
jgi:hypothetical protein